MPPGATTTLHTHDDDDELLSAVYYVYVPEDSGNLVLYDDSKTDSSEKRIEVESRTGDFIFFKPDIRHEVSKNCSTEHRLSIGINFGQDNKPE
jgi:ectoine hydroxylase-related dioxygenase (phytanoyl-CoA dioxygenase family)